MTVTTLQLEVVRVPGKQTVVLPSEDRAKAAAAQLTRRAEALEKLAETGPDHVKSNALERAVYLRAEAEQMLTLHERIGATYQPETLSFDSKGYTNGDAKRAKREATEWVDNHPRFDVVDYQDRLVAAALGKSIEWVDEQDPSIADYLRREIVERGEPDPDRLDFLSSALAS